MLAHVFALLLAGASSQVTVNASYEAPPRPGAEGAVVAFFEARDPAVFVDEEPAPRLKLAADQNVLVDRQPPPSKAGQAFDPETAKVIPPGIPVRFPVALAAGAPHGENSVAASVTYFYCSKRDGWCKKGTAEVLLSVRVP
jgi:hypothetical protein